MSDGFLVMWTSLSLFIIIIIIIIIIITRLDFAPYFNVAMKW